MNEFVRGKLFMSGRSQAVRLPKEFRLPGKEVRIRKFGTGILIEPAVPDWKEVFARLDALPDCGGFEEGWRDQPPMPAPKDVDFD